MLSYVSSFLPPKPQSRDLLTTPALTGIRAVDLKLPKNKVPTNLDKRRTKWRTGPASDITSDYSKTYAIGSEGTVSRYNDLGLFQTIFEAWENHWNVRTSPEDWWFPVACRIAKEIDRAAKLEHYGSEEVRKLFVSHEGKEEIKVDYNVFDIYQVDCDAFFADVSGQIKKRIKVPEYASEMQCDFSTSSSTHRIASQINLMASMQEFFSYTMGICGCGIKGLEMQGEQADWDCLSKKLEQVQKAIAPILRHTYLDERWFKHVHYVFSNLAQTYRSPDSRSVTKFWAGVLMVGKEWEYGPSGFGGHEVEAYNGWLIHFLTGQTSIHKKDVGSEETLEKLRGLNSVPMKVSLTYVDPPISDDAELVAGMLGFTAHAPEETFNGVPSLQPHHLWAMKLPPHSPVRGKGPKLEI